ncbi:MAG: hypothetical protein NVS1B11_29750 [Terriglobales bacterium]
MISAFLWAIRQSSGVVQDVTIINPRGRPAVANGQKPFIEKSEIRRSVYDRMVNAVITIAISVAIAMRDHLSLK